MKIIYLLCLCLYSASDMSCDSNAQTPPSGAQTKSTPPIATNATPVAPSYEILKIGCSDDEKCVVIAYCHPSVFNETAMTGLLEVLSKDFEAKRVVNVNLFDSKDLAQSYAEGTRNLGSLQDERRAWYVRDGKKEFLLFYPDATLREKPVSIKRGHVRNDEHIRIE